MKILTFLFLCLSVMLSYTDDLKVKTIKREHWVGEKIKFLMDYDNKFGYQHFSEKKSGFKSLSYEKYKGQNAIFVKFNPKKNVFTLKIEKTGKKIYLRVYDFSGLRNNIGFYSILKSAKEIYVNKELWDIDLNKCKIVDIKFAEDNVKYAQLWGPFNIYYKIQNSDDIVFKNIMISETYSPVGGYKSELRKDHMLCNLFFKESPYTPLTKENIKDKFNKKTDKMEGHITYLHKNFINKELLKHNKNFIYLDKERNILYSKVIVKKGKPKIFFISNYYSSKWIFHNKIKVKVGDIIKETSIAESPSRETLRGARINERNYYLTSEDISILELIVNNYKKEILVRFIGKNKYYDIILPMDIKLGLKDTWDLYQILRSKTE